MRRAAAAAPAAAKALALLLFAACCVLPPAVECEGTLRINPIDGTSFTEGEPFRIECTGSKFDGLSMRLLCPLTAALGESSSHVPCFENCGRMLCDSGGCDKVPELASARCKLEESTGAQSLVRLTYYFNRTSLRNHGDYSCAIKNSQSTISILMKSATTTARTTTSTTTSTEATSKVETTTGTTARTDATSTTAKLVATTASSSSRSSTANTATPSTRTEKDILTIPPPVPTSNKSPTTEPSVGHAGWYYNSVAGTLGVSDLILIGVALLLCFVWIVGFFCIRCQVMAAQRSNRRGPSPSDCCLTLLCVAKTTPDPQRQNGHANGRQLAGIDAKAAKPLTPSETQEYAEPTTEAEYYNPDLGGDGYYRLQTEFAASDAGGLPQNFGGSQRGLAPQNSFLSRDLPGRHSLHNIRAPRQRQRIPHDLIQGVAEQQQMEEAGDRPDGMDKEEFRRQVERQRMEIENLREQLRDSQLQLARVSQQDLRRSTSASRIRSDPPGEYELLSRSGVPPPPPAAGNASSRGSADLISVEAIAEEASEGTLRRKRQGSIGEAYGTGTLPRC